MANTAPMTTYVPKSKKKSKLFPSKKKKSNPSTLLDDKNGY